MTAENLFAALGGVRDHYIEEAAVSGGATASIRARSARRRYITRLAPVAACVLIAAAILLPRPQNHFVGGGQIGGDNPDHGYQPGPDEGVTVPPRASSPALILNTAAAVASMDAQYPADHFNLALTEAQLAAVFPGLGMTLGAGAHYASDGTVLFVSATETMAAGRTDLPALYKDAYYRTVITLGAGKIPEDCVVVYDGDAVVSDVDGVAVTAFRFDGREDDGVAFYQAEFTTNGIAYRAELYDSDVGEEGARRLLNIVYSVIRSEPASLAALANPEISELRFDALTLTEARADPRFGAYLPAASPDGFVFESAYRAVRPDVNNLSAHWGKPDRYLEIVVSEPRERDFECVIHPDEREKYDMARYPTPFSESVPRELWEVVMNPVFTRGELTRDVVQARAYPSGEDGVAWMSFAVLYGDTLVKVTAKGLTPQQVWDLLETIAG